MVKRMKIYMKLITLIVFAALLLPAESPAQFYRTSKGKPQARKKNVHSGNQIRTTFFNYGLVGRENPAEDFGGEWPINSGHFYVGDISVMVGAEIELENGSVITPVSVADGPRGDNEVDPNNTTIFWGWEPLPGFDNPDSTVVAMSHQRKSWPAAWPDRENDAVDPGWPGQWNGYFGKDQFNADQESYWVMDDSRDQEFIQNYGFHPDSTDLERGGLGLLASVRGLQWSQTLAQNTIFWIYDVKNIGTTDYEKAVFGMIVGTTIGGDGDTNDDNSRFDARENITYSWDSDNIGNNGWTPVNYLGYAFLESPGNSLNGIDDDNDAEFSGATIDVNMLVPVTALQGLDIITIDYSDPLYPRTKTTFPAEGIHFTAHGRQYDMNVDDQLVEIPYNNVDDNLNGLIDENTEIPGDGQDNNGNGLIDEENPHIGLACIDYFSGATSSNMIDEGRNDGVDNDGDWNPDVDDVGLDGKPGTNDFGEGDGIPTSGYQPDGTGRMVDTGLPGEPNIDKTDIDESDQIGLTSFFFFEPYDYVRLQDDPQLWETLRPGFFNDAVQNVDGDFIYGTAYFPLQVGQTEHISLAFFFGNDINDIFRTKNTVQLIYNNDYNFAKAPILPTVKAAAANNKVTLYWDTASETSYDKISHVVTGNGYDFEGYKIYRATYPTWGENGVVTNVFGSRVADVPLAQFDLVNADSGFFDVIDEQLGTVFYLGDNTGLEHTFVDTTVKNGFTYFYAVTAYDHGINAVDPNSGELRILQPAETSKFAALTTAGDVELGQNVVVVRPEAPVAGYLAPGDLMENLQHVSGDATGTIIAEILDAGRLVDGSSYKITFEDNGAFSTQTTALNIIDVTAGSDTLIGHAENIDSDAFVFDGIKVQVLNDWRIRTDTTGVSWQDTTRTILMPDIESGAGWTRVSLGFAQGKAYPAQYQLEIGEVGIDTSAGINVFTLPNLPPRPVNFRVKNLTEDRYVKFNFYEYRAGETTTEDPEDLGILDENDLIVLFEPDGSSQQLTYQVRMVSIDPLAAIPQPGDVLNLPVRKPFLDSDEFQFTVTGPKESPSLAKAQLDNIKVVPNPYIGAASWEARNTYSSGRGERAIHFIHLPRKCTIRIFTVRGELVQTIEHESTVLNGTADWDLLSKDQLDVAYGVYVYHIEAEGIGEKIGKFAIIK
jgi:hypothetical protein